MGPGAHFGTNGPRCCRRYDAIGEKQGDAIVEKQIQVQIQSKSTSKNSLIFDPGRQRRPGKGKKSFVWIGFGFGSFFAYSIAYINRLVLEYLFLHKLGRC